MPTTLNSISINTFLSGNGGESLSIAPSLSAIFDTANIAGARIHSNSWGSSTDIYDYQCEEVDAYMYENPEFLAVFAAGNDGADGLTSIGTPALSKNCVTVGSAVTRVDPYDYQLPSEPTISYFSSLGPTFDNRYGIDIVAPGDYIMSTMAGPADQQQAAIDSEDIVPMQNITLEQMSGTSMATPTTSGNLALIRQYFKNSSFYENLCVQQGGASCSSFTPLASLMKAVLLNSGSQMNQYSFSGYDYYTDLNSFYLPVKPDNYEGYGILNLSSTLPLIQDSDRSRNLFVYNDLSLRSNQCFYFTVTPNCDVGDCVYIKLKVTMAWTDIPYDPSSQGAKSLINDIDLLVVPSTSDTVDPANWGNRYDGGDPYNPVEQVEIQISQQDYNVYVCAETLQSLTQSISLVITYPRGGSVDGPVEVADFPQVTTTSQSYTRSGSRYNWNNYCDTCASYSYDFNQLEIADAVKHLFTFEAEGEITLFQFTMNSYNQVFAEAAAFIIVAPNGLRAQIGGVNSYYYATENLYLRRWYNSQGYPMIRYLNGSNLASDGNLTEWNVYMTLGNTSDVSGSYTYQGNIYIEVDDGVYRPSSSSDSSSTMSATIITVIVIIVVVSCGSGLYYAMDQRRKKQSTMLANANNRSNAAVLNPSLGASITNGTQPPVQPPPTAYPNPNTAPSNTVFGRVIN